MELDILPNTTFFANFNRNQVSRILFVFLCAIIQFLLGFASYYLTFENDVVFAVFLPAGTSFLFITFAFKESRNLGYLAVLGTYLGAFLESFINLILNFGISVFISFIVVLFIAGGNTLQPFLAYLLMEKFIKKETIFTRVKHVVYFFISPAISCIVAALIGVLSLNIASIAPWEFTQQNFFTWWIADLAGLIIIAPTGLVWYLKHTHSRNTNQKDSIRHHIQMFLFGIILISYYFFMATPFIPIEAKISSSYLIIPIIIWSVFLFPAKGAFIIQLMNSFMYIIITLQRRSPFFQMSIANSLIQMQLFIIILTLTTLVLFALHFELMNTLYKLKQYSSKLEIEVKVLSGLLPICAHCKKIRDDSFTKEWKPLEEYITNHSEAMFTHSLCPECMEKYYK